MVGLGVCVCVCASWSLSLYSNILRDRARGRHRRVEGDVRQIWSRSLWFICHAPNTCRDALPTPPSLWHGSFWRARSRGSAWAGLGAFESFSSVFSKSSNFPRDTCYSISIPIEHCAHKIAWAENEGQRCHENQLFFYNWKSPSHHRLGRCVCAVWWTLRIRSFLALDDPKLI